MEDTTIRWRFVTPKFPPEYPQISMAESAENLAEKYRISRARQDEFAYNSHMKAISAIDEVRFAEETRSCTSPTDRVLFPLARRHEEILHLRS